MLCVHFNRTATPEIYTLSLHDALPILECGECLLRGLIHDLPELPKRYRHWVKSRSEEHTSELQSRQYLVCRLLLEKKNKIQLIVHHNSEPTNESKNDKYCRSTV